MSNNETGDTKLKKIAEQFNMTESAVSLSIKASINKIVDQIVAEGEYDIFEVCIELHKYLGIEPKEIFKKLSDSNKALLRVTAKKYYNGQEKINLELERTFGSLFAEK